MVKNKLIILALVEAFWMFIAGITIFNYKVTKESTIYSILVFGMSSYGIRSMYEMFNIPLGSHSILLMIIFIGCCVFILKLPFGKSIMMTYGSLTLIILGEWLITIPLIEKFNIIIDENYYQSWLGIGCSMAGHSLIIVVWGICLIKNYRKRKNGFNQIEIEV